MFPKIMVPQNGWLIREIPIKIDDLGVPLFLETPICSFYGQKHYTSEKKATNDLLGSFGWLGVTLGSPNLETHPLVLYHNLQFLLSRIGKYPFSDLNKPLFPLISMIFSMLSEHLWIVCHQPL